jgi:SOS response regulatory protein OraA/RecX
LDEEDLIMNLSAAYLKKREEWKEEGELKTAINLLRQGFSAEVIAEAASLSIEMIANLRDQSSL